MAEPSESEIREKKLSPRCQNQPQVNGLSENAKPDCGKQKED